MTARIEKKGFIGNIPLGLTGLPDDVQQDIEAVKQLEEKLMLAAQEVEDMSFPKKKTVPIEGLIQKELRLCRFSTGDKNVAKVASRYAKRSHGTLNVGKARKIIHSIIMTNTQIFEK